MRRALTTFDAVCLGLNAVVGSGIYLFPGTLARSLGPASSLAWVATGALCLPLALAFAVLGAEEERTGGPLRYAERAFGRGASFVVGWSAWTTSVISWAAVARAVSENAAPFWPFLAGNNASLAVSSAIVAGLAWLNVRGVKIGARVMVALTLAKLVPLLIFLGVGAWHLHARHFEPMAPHGWGAMPAMTLMTLFAYQGFEVVGVPSGEARDPRHAVPRAVLLSLLLPLLVYTLVQLVFVGVGGGNDPAPLAAAAERFLGRGGATLLALGGLVSTLGFSAGTALCTPRYLEALAEERLLPAELAKPHPRYGTPATAIIVSAAAALLVGSCFDFGRLVDLAALAVLGQYVATSAALMRLGRGRTRWLGFVAVLVSVLFAAQGQPREYALLGLILLGGALLSLASSARC
jgi:amino acid transporter